jgi:hypothetical protein
MATTSQRWVLVGLAALPLALGVARSDPDAPWGVAAGPAGAAAAGPDGREDLTND